MNTIKSSKTFGRLALLAVWSYFAVRLFFAVWLVVMYNEGLFPCSNLLCKTGLLIGFLLIVWLLFYLWIRRAYLNMAKRGVHFSYELKNAFLGHALMGWCSWKPMYITVQEILDGADGLLSMKNVVDQKVELNTSKKMLITLNIIMCAITIIPFSITDHSPLCFAIIHVLSLISISMFVAKSILRYIRAESELIKQSGN